MDRGNALDYLPRHVTPGIASSIQALWPQCLPESRDDDLLAWALAFPALFAHKPLPLALLPRRLAEVSPNGVDQGLGAAVVSKNGPTRGRIKSKAGMVGKSRVEMPQCAIKQQMRDCKTS